MFLQGPFGVQCVLGGPSLLQRIRIPMNHSRGNEVGLYQTSVFTPSMLTFPAIPLLQPRLLTLSPDTTHLLHLPLMGLVRLGNGRSQDVSGPLPLAPVPPCAPVPGCNSPPAAAPAPGPALGRRDSCSWGGDWGADVISWLWKRVTGPMGGEDRNQRTFQSGQTRNRPGRVLMPAREGVSLGSCD